MTEEDQFAQDQSQKSEAEGLPLDQELAAASTKERLAKIRDALHTLATGQESDSANLKKQLCLIGGHLDSALQSLRYEQQQSEWRAQQALRDLDRQAQQALCDLDLERARSRIEPIKPSPPGGPHRIDWRREIGF
jgi:hypothetical protein